MAAARAGPRLATLRRRVPTKGALLLALWAHRVFAIRRIVQAPQVLKARSIVGELAHELHQRVRGLGRVGPTWCVAVYRRHNVRLPDAQAFVKLPYARLAAKTT
jgi:hypothetical protein